MRVFYLVVDLGDGESGVFFFNDSEVFDLFIDKAEQAGDYISESASFSADNITGLHFYSRQSVLDKYGDYEN